MFGSYLTSAGADVFGGGHPLLGLACNALSRERPQVQPLAPASGGQHGVDHILPRAAHRGHGIASAGFAVEGFYLRFRRPAIVGNFARGQKKMDVGIAMVAIARAMQGPFDRDAVYTPQIFGVLLGNGDLLGQSQAVRHGSDDLAGHDGILASLPAIRYRPITQARSDMAARHYIGGAGGIFSTSVDVSGPSCRTAAAARRTHDALARAAPVDGRETVMRRRHDGILW